MKTSLYLGLNPPPSTCQRLILHAPVIRIVPRLAGDKSIRAAMQNFAAYTHLIFTSQTTVELFFAFASIYKLAVEQLQRICIIAVGQATAIKIKTYGAPVSLIAKEELAEGIVAVLSQCDLTNAHIFWPHSALSRPVISSWLDENHIRYTSCIFYDTLVNTITLPDLKLCDEIIFTSPSTVDAFLQLHGHIPEDMQLTCIGPITKQHLNSKKKAEGRENENENEVFLHCKKKLTL